ncbi:MAG: 50S ribosomal protein L24 [Alphaproteobacteria bacterium]
MTQIKCKIRKGDTIVVTTGKDKGKTGEVLRVLLTESRVLVKGVNIVKRHVKPSATSAGGIVEQEKTVHVSNVAFYDAGQATRLGYKIDKAGKKERFAKKTGQVV